MKLYATTTSERASKGQGGEYLDIVITGAYQTELLSLHIQPDGPNYRLTGWTHDNHRIGMQINENMAKGNQQKDEITGACGIKGHGTFCRICFK